MSAAHALLSASSSGTFTMAAAFRPTSNHAANIFSSLCFLLRSSGPFSPSYGRRRPSRVWSLVLVSELPHSERNALTLQLRLGHGNNVCLFWEILLRSRPLTTDAVENAIQLSGEFQPIANGILMPFAGGCWNYHHWPRSSADNTIVGRLRWRGMSVCMSMPACPPLTV